MRSFFLFLCWFVATVLAVITGIFGALLIFNKLWHRGSKSDSKTEPDPSIVAEWDVFKIDNKHVVKPTLAEYTIVEVREPNKHGKYSQYQSVSEEILILVWIQDGENVGSQGFEVTDENQADTWMKSLG